MLEIEKGVVPSTVNISLTTWLDMSNGVEMCCIQRDQLHQQEALVSSLQQQLRKVIDSQTSKQQQQQLGREEGGLLHRNASLKDSNTRLTEELFRMKERNKRLEEVSECLPIPLPLTCLDVIFPGHCV